MGQKEGKVSDGTEGRGGVMGLEKLPGDGTEGRKVSKGPEEEKVSVQVGGKHVRLWDWVWLVEIIIR